MEASSVTNALYEQLNFRGEKQKVISSNIANINTPNYKTKDLIFEDELKSADNSLKCKEVKDSVDSLYKKMCDEM
jgi:flagellar basal-body rod protein FlgB